MIRVVIERNIRPNHLEEYLDLIRQVRKQANHQSGFIAGELLHEKDKPQHAMIISSWENCAAWQQWFESEQRANTLKQMSPYLVEQETITILESSPILA
ncbi:MAG: antibiotic biosynthesis monooxygenase family protein [Enterobacterales bacterium]|nr:antibiotic biosynthesis monooxygenase family protein [Enterobacterales bacterium]